MTKEEMQKCIDEKKAIWVYILASNKPVRCLPVTIDTINGVEVVGCRLSGTIGHVISALVDFSKTIEGAVKIGLDEKRIEADIIQKIYAGGDYD